MRYFVDSFYDHSPEVRSSIIDYVIIGVATEADEKRNGENWKTDTEGCSFKVYDDLEDAIVNAGCIAEEIQFKGLSENDLDVANAVVKRLMNDKQYLKSFGRLL